MLLCIAHHSIQSRNAIGLVVDITACTVQQLKIYSTGTRIFVHAAKAPLEATGQKVSMSHVGMRVSRLGETPHGDHVFPEVPLRISLLTTRTTCS